MKLEYRVKRALQNVKGRLQEAESSLADEAIQCMGKELNTQKSWELKGKIQGLRYVKNCFYDESIWSWYNG